VAKSLAMTSRTACHDLSSSNLVLLFQLQPLVCRQISVLPLHVEDLGLRPNKLFGFAVTLETPFHLKRVLLIHGGHVVDLTVTRRTTDSLRYVNTVIEICKLRQVVNAFPFDRFVFSEASTDRFEVRTVIPDLAMTVHTGLRRRHPGRGGCLDRGVTVTTIDAVVARVVLVTELHRLLLFQIATRQIRRASDLRINIERRPCKNDAEYHAYSRDVICTLVKKLRHYQVSRTRRFPEWLNLNGYLAGEGPGRYSRNSIYMIEKASVKLKQFY